MIVDAEALQRAHAIVASTGAPMLRWHTGPRGMDLRGVGDLFSAEAVVAGSSQAASPFNFAAPTRLTGAWLNGIRGEVIVELDESQRVVDLAAERSSITVAVELYGQDLASADNLTFDLDGLSVLSTGADLWQAIDDVSWASSLRAKSFKDQRFRAVHLSYGRVWATDTSNGAWIDLELPEDAYPMIPADLGAITKHVDMDTAVVALDPKGRLRVIDGDCDLVAPLIGGDPLANLTEHEAVIRARNGGQRCTVNSKHLHDALTRLDRVDLDELAKNANLDGRVQLSFADGCCELAVLVHGRKAIESIDAEHAGDCSMIFPIKRLRECIAFLDTDEVELSFFSIKAPVTFDAGDRHAFLMPVVTKL